MPVVLRVNGYKFFFYEADVANEPPHVHINKAGNEAKFWLKPIRVEREGKFRKVTCATSNASSRTIMIFC